MKELEKNLEATGGVPAEAELAAINRFAKSPLRAEEVYTFSLRLCDNEEDRDWERFDTAALNTLGDLDRKSTRLNSSHITPSRMPSSA